MLISAVIPTYNSAKYLRQSVGSVLAQTRQLDELIVVDDGSTDDTREVVASFGKRVTYIYQTNRGLSAARNTGIRAASSEWIALLDSDDWWKPDKIRLQENAVREFPEAGLVYTSVMTVFPGGTQAARPCADPGALWPAMRLANPITPSSVMALRSALLEAGGFNEQLTACEDWDMWVRLRERHRFAAVPEPLTVYRYGETSMSNDAGRMLSNTDKILESTLLADLSGMRRRLWRRRILAIQLARAAYSARVTGPRDERKYLTRSLALWPSPFDYPKRYVALVRNLIGPRAYSVLTRKAAKSQGQA